MDKLQLPFNMVINRRWLLCLALLASIIGVASATTYSAQGNSIMFKSALGLLIPLGIENWVPATEAIMYYSWISIGLLVGVAAFSGQSNESRFTFFIPLLAAVFVYIGWLQAPDSVSYWGMIVCMILMGALMYINDMNHEKYGIPGPGSKVITIAIMIIVFEASVAIMASPSFNPFPDATSMSSSQKSVTCGAYGYSCDSNGNIDLSASVSSINNAGGTNLDIVSMATWTLTMAWAMIKFIILVVGAVLLFSVVLVASYPALAASPQALLLLGVLQLVIWAIYMVAWFNWGFKPGLETAQV